MLTLLLEHIILLCISHNRLPLEPYHMVYMIWRISKLYDLDIISFPILNFPFFDFDEKFDLDFQMSSQKTMFGVFTNSRSYLGSSQNNNPREIINA